MFRQFHALYLDIHRMEQQVMKTKGATKPPPFNQPSHAYLKVAGKAPNESKNMLSK